mgnify:CR=1 FL=1
MKSKIHRRPAVRSGPFRIESNQQLHSPHWPVSGVNEILVHDRALAVVLAAKSQTVPCGSEIRVVHTPSGEIIFRKTTDCACDDASLH